RPVTQEQILVAQAMLGGAAFARIAEYQKAEVAIPCGAFRLNLEQAVVRDVLFPVAILDSQDHLYAPGVGAGRCPVVPDPGCPAPAVEKPAESPDGIHSNQDGSHRQAYLETPAKRVARRVPHVSHSPREA